MTWRLGHLWVHVRERLRELFLQEHVDGSLRIATAGLQACLNEAITVARHNVLDESHALCQVFLVRRRSCIPVHVLLLVTGVDKKCRIYIIRYQLHSLIYLQECKGLASASGRTELQCEDKEKASFMIIVEQHAAHDRTRTDL